MLIKSVIVYYYSMRKNKHILKHLLILFIAFGVSFPALAESNLKQLSPKSIKGLEIADPSIPKDEKGNLIMPELKIPMPSDVIKRLEPITVKAVASVWKDADIVILAEDYSGEGVSQFSQTSYAANQFILLSKGFASSLGLAGVNDVEQNLADYAAKGMRENKVRVTTRCPYDIFGSREPFPQEIMPQVSVLSQFIPAPCVMDNHSFMFINSRMPLGLYILAAVRNNIPVHALGKINPNLKHKNVPFWYYEYLAKGKSLSLPAQELSNVLFRSIAALRPSSSNKMLVMADMDSISTENNLPKQLTAAGYRVKVILCASTGQQSIASKLGAKMISKDVKTVEYAPITQAEKKFFSQADGLLWI